MAFEPPAKQPRSIDPYQPLQHMNLIFNSPDSSSPDDYLLHLNGDSWKELIVIEPTGKGRNRKKYRCLLCAANSHGSRIKSRKPPLLNKHTDNNWTRHLKDHHWKHYKKLCPVNAAKLNIKPDQTSRDQCASSVITCSTNSDIADGNPDQPKFHDTVQQLPLDIPSEQLCIKPVLKEEGSLPLTKTESEQTAKKWGSAVEMLQAEKDAVEQEMLRLMTRVNDLSSQFEEQKKEAAAAAMERQRQEQRYEEELCQSEREILEMEDMLSRKRNVLRNQYEEHRRQCAETIRNLESELEAERRMRKKLEVELFDLRKREASRRESFLPITLD
ncbi:Myosin-10 [Cichlidogyrus casuarinus]|uniref:Myosin-10 n=1 Tax=Cichlidogyrus casuarinus TaxID=1844966 RepID=A0ABD2Q453_9PLAT